MGGIGPELIRKYRATQGENGKPLSYRKFTAELNKHLPYGLSYTHTTLVAWEKGKFDMPVEMLFMLAHLATGWVRDFARDALRALGAEVERRR